MFTKLVTLRPPDTTAREIVADAPIDTLPLFVRAGSIVPFGSEVQSAQQRQAIASVRVYPGAEGSFTLSQDDGKTYAYEKGGGSVTKLTWDEAGHQLKHEVYRRRVDRISQW